MKPREITNMLIVVSAWGTYLILVLHKVANVEGFVALTMYIIKKYLDLNELQTTGGLDAKTSIVESTVVTNPTDSKG